MSEIGYVMGRWHLRKSRCHYCNKPRERVYVVSDPPITGSFCSKFCYQKARETYDQAKKQEK